jgi:hypothetical protein
MYKTIFLLVCVAAKFTLSSSTCNTHSSSCQECIQTPDCFWRLKKNEHNASRCLSLKSGGFSRVNVNMLYNPVNWMQVIKSESLNEAVLIRPQKIKMGLRTGIPFAFNIESKERDDAFAVQNLGTASQFLHVSIADATVQMQIVKCPQDPSQFRHQIDIVSTKTNQSVSAEVNLICTCSCEEDAVENAEECTGRGTYKCGVCVCNPGTSGTMCGCEGDSNPAGCLNPQNNTTVCSNRGDCICGYCFCKERVNRNEHYVGRYCECDDFSCDRLDGKLCGGPERGECFCNQCECKAGWTGRNCGTPLTVN